MSAVCQFVLFGGADEQAAPLGDLHVLQLAPTEMLRLSFCQVCCAGLGCAWFYLSAVLLCARDCAG